MCWLPFPQRRTGGGSGCECHRKLDTRSVTATRLYTVRIHGIVQYTLYVYSHVHNIYTVVQSIGAEMSDVFARVVYRYTHMYMYGGLQLHFVYKRVVVHLQCHVHVYTCNMMYNKILCIYTMYMYIRIFDHSLFLSQTLSQLINSCHTSLTYWTNLIQEPLALNYRP